MNYKILVFSMFMFLLLASCGDKKITNPESDVPQITSISPSSGDFGDLVTLYGKNFGATNRTSFVSLNSVKVVECMEWGGAEIKIKIPVGATSGDLSVTVNGIKSNEKNLQIKHDFHYGTVTDIDGNIYKTIKIGNQVWMTENLNVSHYRNGDTIAQVSDSTEWSNLITGAWCYYENDANNGTTYGKLYKWYAVNDSRGLAPEGWHVSSDAEWTTLSTYLGGESVAGGKLKEVGTTHWASPNSGATNATGFSALPGAYRYGNGAFHYIGYYGYWWCSTESTNTSAWYLHLDYDRSSLGRWSFYKECGYAVRCVKD